MRCLPRSRGFFAAILLTGSFVMVHAAVPPEKVPTAGAGAGAGAEKKKAPVPDAEKKKASKETIEDLKRAAAQINAGQIDEGLDALLALVATYPDDPNTKHARALLADYGVGNEIRVTLKDRKVFRESFGIKDAEILSVAEKSLAQLREKFYSRLEPSFETTRLRLQFFDCQARFRELTGMVTASGVFEPVSADSATRSFEGKIVWHFPETGMNPRDRQLTLQTLLYHEEAHYLTHIHFGGYVPRLINEGISTWIESRLATAKFVGFHATRRQLLESDARNSLNTVVKFEDFVKSLDAERGFGTGGAMVERWYAIAYASFDLLADGVVKGKRKSSCEQVLEALHALCRERARSGTREEPAERFTNREVLERLVLSCHGATLEEFHKALVAHLMKYRQM